MIRFVILLASTISMGCAAPVSMAQRRAPVVARAESDDLKDLQQAVHSGSDASGNATNESVPKRKWARKSSDDSCGSTDDGNSISGSVAFAVIASPFIVPTAVLEDDYDHATEFPDYPYADGAKGSLLLNNFDKIPKQSLTGTLQTFVIPQAHDVDRLGGRLLLDSVSRFGVDAETNYWTKGLLTRPSDQLWTGDANLVYRFAESERFQWRAGAGINWLSDNIRNEAGVNFTYGVEMFPARPWTISSVIDVGSLGHAGLFHNRTTVGAMVGQTELFAGYDYFQVGSARFQGPVAGIGWRF